MSVEIESTRLLGLQSLIARVKEGVFYVHVGVLEDAEPEEDGTSMALVAATNEYGSQDGHVPERAFFRHGLATGQRDFVRLNRISLHQILQSGLTMEVALERLGSMGAGSIKKAIRTSRGWALPNAPSTKAKKDSSQPLKDTGNLEQEITWEVPA